MIYTLQNKCGESTVEADSIAAAINKIPPSGLVSGKALMIQCNGTEMERAWNGFDLIFRKTDQ